MKDRTSRRPSAFDNASMILSSILVMIIAFLGRTIYISTAILAVMILGILLLIIGIVGGVLLSIPHIFTMMIFPEHEIKEDNPQEDVRIFG